MSHSPVSDCSVSYEIPLWNANLYVFKTQQGTALRIKQLDEGSPEIPTIYIGAEAVIRLINELKASLL